MKFVVTWTTRAGGSASERRKAAADTLKLLASWQPSQAADVSEWVNRVDGNGGFAVVETDDAGEMLKDLGVWTSFFDYQIYPVLDVTEAAAKSQEALAVVAQLD